VHAGHLEVVKVLVAAGADLSATNRRKKTALQLALARKHAAIARILQGYIGLLRIIHIALKQSIGPSPFYI
jgi:ankyrin repeat protein